MNPLYYDVNGTRCFPRTLKEAFPNDLDPNPFNKKTQQDRDIDTLIGYVGVFFVGFILGISYVSK
jgi:hypothetical protein